MSILLLDNTKKIKWWIWFYFWALLFEGAIRKWILPQYSDLLLIIRDPIIFRIYYLAYIHNKFPENKISKLTVLVAFLLFFVGLFNGVINDQNLVISLFGLRTNFLHLFLIYVIPNVFDDDDVKSLGKWVLILSVPMAILMSIQFISTPDSFINKTTGLEGGQQITSALGKIRPPGIFTFISGPACYYPLVASFLLYGFLKIGTYSKYLLLASGFSTVIALSVSGSRGTVISVLTVVAFFLIITILRSEFFVNSLWVVLIGILLGLGLSLTPIFFEGVSVLSARTESASAAESGGGGILGRIFSGFTDAFSNLENLPLFGYGLGLGTNAGAALAGSREKYLLAEGEWQRIILESGIVLGVIYLLLRIIIIFNMGQYALKNLKSGNTLSLLLLGACLPLLLNGQFGQPTILGFAVLGGGLSLAAGRIDTSYLQADENITHR